MEKLKNNTILKILNPTNKLLGFHLLMNLVVLLCISLSSYIHIPLSGFKDYMMYAIHILLLQFTVFGFLYFISLNKWLFRVVFNLLFFVFSLFSFWVYTQDISITDSLISVVLETKPSIVVDTLSIPYVLFIIVITSVLVFLNRRYNRLNKKFSLPLLVLACGAIYTYSYIEKRRINTLKSRLPYNVVFGVSKYLNSEKEPLKEVNKEVSAAHKNLNIVLVLGETVRADHIGLNGYKRNTTPKLSQRKNIISFPNINSIYGYTSASLPVILTDYEGFEKKLDSLTSIYTVFNKIGYETTWIGNQELEIGYKDLARSNKKVHLVDSLRSVFSFRKALDEELLKPYVEALEPPKPKLITLQMMGSHWYYNHRYTEEYQKFHPVTDSKYIPSQSAEQIINSYDNTIVYLDTFLDEVIKPLEERGEPSIMIYLADHGEILGEQGMWLHAQESEYAKNPAMMIWFSDAFRSTFSEGVSNVGSNSKNHYTTAFFYHSLLDVIKVEGIQYNQEKSIFRLNDSIQ